MISAKKQKYQTQKDSGASDSLEDSMFQVLHELQATISETDELIGELRKLVEQANNHK